MEDKIFFKSLNYFYFMMNQLFKPKDVPEGDKIDMARGIDYKFKRLREVERQVTLKDQLKVKFGDISNNLEEQITNASIEKLKELTLNIFNVTSEEKRVCQEKCVSNLNITKKIGYSSLLIILVVSLKELVFK